VTTTTLELLREGRRVEIWRKYCGFIDLSLDEFMGIQRRLLMEQIDLLSKCELGRHLLGDEVPTTVEEFRESVPLTTYEDYAPYLLVKREEALPVRPHWWLHTSGRSGEYPYKWIPYTDGMVKRLGECSMAGFIFGSCSRRDQFVFDEKDNMLFALAPFPYISGAALQAVASEFNFTYLPPMQEAVKMEFRERISAGFKLALKEGMGGFNGVASVLARIGAQFVEGGGGTIKPSLELLHPKVAVRILKALIRSRLDGRKHVLPKDLWDVKCIGVGGTDTSLFKDQITEYWGRMPIENYACTEAGFLASQTWNGKGMTFYPDCNFLEFIEYGQGEGEEDAVRVPKPVLLDEVEAGKRYEIVVTNFMGGAMTRYRVGDIIEIVALKDDDVGIHLPQMLFYSRSNDLIDLGGLARLTERTIWHAIANAGIPYTDWVARKEYEGKDIVLHLYIEPKGEGQFDLEEIRDRIEHNLRGLDHEYADLKRQWNMEPVRVSLLAPGSHANYYETRQREGADLAHSKPPHMNPPEQALRLLLGAGAKARVG